MLDQANKTTQNQTVGLLVGARAVLSDPEIIGAELAKHGIKRTADAAALGAAGAATYVGYHYTALFEFIAVNAEPLKAYVITVFDSHPHLSDMIDRIRLLWKRTNNKP